MKSLFYAFNYLPPLRPSPLGHIRRPRPLQSLRLGMQHKGQKCIHCLLHSHLFPSNNCMHPLRIIPAPRAVRFRRRPAQLHEQPAQHRKVCACDFIRGWDRLPAWVIGHTTQLLNMRIKWEVRIWHPMRTVVVVGVVALYQQRPR